MIPAYSTSLYHAAQDEDQVLEDLAVDEMQRLSRKHGPGINLGISGTGAKDQLSWKLKVIYND